MNHLTSSVSPGLAAPQPRREPRLVLALSGLLARVKAFRLFGNRQPAASSSLEPPIPRSRAARPLMAAAWFGSLGPGPMCLPGQPAITFDPGYRD